MNKKINLILTLTFALTILSACSPTTTEPTGVEDSNPPAAESTGSEPNEAAVNEIKTPDPVEEEDKLELNEILSDRPETDGIKKYKLVAPDDYAPIYLELRPDLTFAMDFNYCQGIAKGEGTFSMENGLYFLDVTSSKEMASLSTVNLEIKQTSETELKVVSEVYRTENGQKTYFCTPMSDPDNKMDGEEYNVYKLVD